MSTYRVGDRVAIAPHLDLWMAGCRYATITSINEGATGGRFYFADLDTGRNVTLSDGDLAGVVSSAHTDADADLPDGYRWATAEETEWYQSRPAGANLDSFAIVHRTADVNGVPYTQGEADLAVRI